MIVKTARCLKILVKSFKCTASFFQTLGYIVKFFAKECDIGDASRGSLSSYAYILVPILTNTIFPILHIHICKIFLAKKLCKILFTNLLKNYLPEIVQIFVSLVLSILQVSWKNFDSECLLNKICPSKKYWQKVTRCKLQTFVCTNICKPIFVIFGM
jgi:hypothetical protein